MRGITLLVLCLGFTALLAAPALSASEAEKQLAIDKGLAWLAGTQQADGRWEYGDDYYDTAATGAALLAFLEKGYTAGTNVVIDTGGGPVDYGDVVGDGLAYVFSKAQVYGISAEPAGNPDSDANRVGVKFVLGGNTTRDTYVTGLVLPAIASTGTPNALVPSGPLVGRTDGSGPGGAWTFRDVVRNGVDYFGYSQADSGWARGGWRYYADYGQADNSTSQWPTLSLFYATLMGVNTPQFVKDELRYWVDYIQNPGDGGSYYDNNFAGWGSNVSRTGTWLLQADLIGTDATMVTPAEVAAALAYLNAQWQTGANSTWNGNFGHPYGMWAAYKGLEVQIGLGDTTTITNLPALGTWRGAAATLDPGDAWNWWESYCEYLVATQNASGSWNGYSYWNGPLATAWDINILAATRIPDDGVIPEPGTMALFGLGLLGAGLAVRRRRRS